MPGSPEIYQFDSFHVDVPQRTIVHDGVELSVTPKAFDTLVTLLRNSGEVVRKQALMDSVWPETFVEDSVLTQNVYTLRKLLGDSGPIYRTIATVPRIGYRFVAPVRKTQALTGAGDPERLTKVAVLPFQALGGDEEEMRILGIGMADALITRLSRIRRLTVRPTSAVIRLGDSSQDPLLAGRSLGVEAVLEARLQIAGGRARVTAQLVGIGSRESIWGASFEESADDLFALQDAMAEKLALAIEPELSAQERDALGPQTESAAAYNAYLRGRYFWNQRSRDALARAIEQFEQAAEHDPDWALPRVGLADCYVLLPFYGDAPAKDAFSVARREAAAALKLDPDLAEAVTVLAYSRFVYERNWEAAETGLREALRMAPDYATAHHWFAFLLASRSRFEDAVLHASRAIDLDPVSVIHHADLGWVLYFARQYPEAREQLEATIELDPSFHYARLALALVLLQFQEIEAASEQARQAADRPDANSAAVSIYGYVLARAGKQSAARTQLERLQAEEFVPASRLALVLTGLGDHDAALDELERAFEERSRFVAFLRVWPAYDPLRNHPRFRELVDTHLA